MLYYNINFSYINFFIKLIVLILQSYPAAMLIYIKEESHIEVQKR